MSNSESNSEHNPIYGDPFDSLIQHLKERDLRFSQDPKNRRASLTMQSRSGVLFKCRFRFDATGEVFQIDIHYPILVQEKFRSIASEFLTRANWGLVVGNYSFDFSDGEVVYHSSHIMEEGKLSDDIIERLFRTSLSTADRYCQGLMRVIYAGDSAQDAVDLCELYRFEEEPKKVTDTAAGPQTKPKSSPKRTRSKGKKRASGKIQQKADLPTQNPQPSSEEQNEHHEEDGEGEGRKAA